MPSRTPAETPHSQPRGAGEWLISNVRVFRFLSVSPQEARKIVDQFKKLDIRVLSQIHFAVLLKNFHRSNEALKWLSEASKSPQHAILVARLKKMWNQ